MHVVVRELRVTSSDRFEVIDITTEVENWPGEKEILGFKSA
jgi:thiamine phosphate synthase YjbQ (UPF0047 family)